MGWKLRVFVIYATLVVCDFIGCQLSGMQYPHETIQDHIITHS